MILVLFFIWRIFLFIPLLLGEKLLTFRTGYEYTHLWKFVEPYAPVDHVLLYPWANFDGIHYLLIAGQGYTNNLGFLPFFPTLIHSVASLFGGGEPFGAAQFFTGLFLANLFFLASLYLIFKLLRLDYSVAKSYQVIVFLLAFPTSFFFGSIYSESIFLLLTLAAFYFARKKQWVLVSIAGFFLAITRIVGIFILPALIIEFFQQEKVIHRWKALTVRERLQLFFKFLPLCFVPLSIMAYAFYNYLQKGDYLYFLHAHGNLGNGRAVDAVISIPQTVYRYGKILFSVPVAQFEWWIGLLEISTFFIVLLLLVLAIKKKVRLSYIVFSCLCFLLPVLSGTFSGLPRYSVILFPIFITLMLIKSKVVKVFYIIISTILLFILLMFFSKGYFIA